MSAEDLERYETEIELQLYREYRDVLPMFQYVVETERRFYLANDVKLDAKQENGRTYFELQLRDAWVWDMYRPRRFVDDVHVVTFKDVNIEELPGKDLSRAMTDERRAVGAAGEEAVARWYGDAGYAVLARNWRVRAGEIDVIVRRNRTIVFCEVKTRRGDAFGLPAEAVTPRKQARLRQLAVQWLSENDVRADVLRFDVASVKPDGRGAWIVDVLENAF